MLDTSCGPVCFYGEFRRINGGDVDAKRRRDWPICMVRPRVARGFHRSVGFAVLHQGIRLPIGARLSCEPPWIRARLRSRYPIGLGKVICVTRVRRSVRRGCPLSRGRWRAVITRSNRCRKCLMGRTPSDENSTPPRRPISSICRRCAGCANDGQAADRHHRWRRVDQVRQRGTNSCQYCWRCSVCHSPHPALPAGGAAARPGHSSAGHECRFLLSPGSCGPLLDETATLTSRIHQSGVDPTCCHPIGGSGPGCKLGRGNLSKGSGCSLVRAQPAAWPRTGTMCAARPHRSRLPTSLRWQRRRAHRKGHASRAGVPPAVCCHRAVRRAYPSA
jgi:hypothetical protein